MGSIFAIPFYLFCAAILAFVLFAAWLFMGWWLVVALVTVAVAGIVGESVFPIRGRPRMCPGDGIDHRSAQWSNKEWLKRMQN